MKTPHYAIGIAVLNEHIEACATTMNDSRAFLASVNALKVQYGVLSATGSFDSALIEECKHALEFFGDIRRVAAWVEEDIRQGIDTYGAGADVLEAADFIQRAKGLANYSQRCAVFRSDLGEQMELLVRDYAQRQAASIVVNNPDRFSDRLQAQRSSRTQHSNGRKKRAKDRDRNLPEIVAPAPTNDGHREWVRRLMHQRSSVGERGTDG